MKSIEKVKSLSEWPGIREAITTAVHKMIGSLPKDRVEVQAKVVDEMEFPGYVRRRMNYFIDEWERASAWLFLPEGRDEVPAVICCHQMTAAGKDEPAGMEGDPRLAFAARFAELGYAALAPDSITAGDRVPNGLDPLDTKMFYKENPKSSAICRMLLDHLYAVDMLSDMKRIDASRIGVIGNGLMGAANALLLAAFDERVQVCAAVGGLARLHEDSRVERWVEQGNFVLIPALKEYLKKKDFPFDWEQIIALAAPSPMLLVTPEGDPNFPEAHTMEKSVQTAANIYKLLSAPNALCNHTYPGEKLDPEALEVIDDWFARWL